ncbi:unnamed protein product [Rhizophagus irregularis]|nr:unnamed protein product [Rhizophagus irregularis]
MKIKHLLCFQKHYFIAQVYLGKLYKVPKKAFYWYQKSAENGNKLAQFYLGLCYENEKEKGIDQDLEKSYYIIGTKKQQ